MPTQAIEIPGSEYQLTDESSNVMALCGIVCGTACVWITLTALTAGLSAAIAAAGADILKHDYPSSYDVATTAAAAAAGTTLLNGSIILLGMMFAFCMDVGIENPRPRGKSGVISTAAASAASTTIGALIGYGMLRASGHNMHGMNAGDIAAASAVGGAVVGGGLAVALSCCCKGDSKE